MAAQPGPFGTPAADHSEAPLFFTAVPQPFGAGSSQVNHEKMREIGIMLDFTHHPRLKIAKMTPDKNG